MNAHDVVEDRKEWQKERIIIRERFEANRHIKDPFTRHKLLDLAEDELRLNLHPIPYIRELL